MARSSGNSDSAFGQVDSKIRGGKQRALRGKAFLEKLVALCEEATQEPSPDLDRIVVALIAEIPSADRPNVITIARAELEARLASAQLYGAVVITQVLLQLDINAGVANDLAESLELYQTAISAAAIHYKSAGDHELALQLLRLKEIVCSILGKHDAEQCEVWEQANILYARGDLDSAWKLYVAQEQICRQHHFAVSLRAALWNQCLILKKRGDRDGMLARLREQEEICERLELHDLLRTVLDEQAIALYDKKEYAASFEKLCKQEQLGKTQQTEALFYWCLYKQTVCLRALARFDDAIARLEAIGPECRNLALWLLAWKCAA